MLDKEVVYKRLNHLENKIKNLQEIEQFSKEEFSNNRDVYFRYERALHLALEAVIDLGNHLIAEKNLRTPDSNRDVFKVLYENNFINKKLCSKLEKLAGSGNILVYDYMTLDRELEFAIIRDNLDDFRKFMEIVVDNF